jgi:hypothetical protein
VIVTGREREENDDDCRRIYLTSAEILRQMAVLQLKKSIDLTWDKLNCFDHSWHNSRRPGKYMLKKSIWSLTGLGGRHGGRNICKQVISFNLWISWRLPAVPKLCAELVPKSGGGKRSENTCLLPSCVHYRRQKLNLLFELGDLINETFSLFLNYFIIIRKRGFKAK